MTKIKAFVVALAVMLAMIGIGYKNSYSPIFIFIALLAGWGILFYFARSEIKDQNKSNFNPVAEAPHGNYSETLTEKDGLPENFIIQYKNISPAPLIQTDEHGTTVSFGANRIIIKPNRLISSYTFFDFQAIVIDKANGRTWQLPPIN